MLLKWACYLSFCFIAMSACVPAGQTRTDKLQQADVHYKMAAAHMQANNPTMALKELLQAVQKDPHNSSIHVSLAQAYQQKKAYSLAERHYLESLKLSENDPRYQNNLAALYLDMEEWDKSIEYFEKASNNILFNSAHVAVTGKAYAYYKKGDYSKALTFYKEATELAPHFAPAYYRQSEVYRQLKNTELEKVSLQRAIDIAPQFIQARYRFAELLIDTDELKKAEQQLQTIIEFSPSSEIGLQANDLLRTLSGS
jgi:tetratricopeptide (TPR) repeat protein